jgi:hypothetical protein
LVSLASAYFLISLPGDSTSLSPYFFGSFRETIWRLHKLRRGTRTLPITLKEASC